MTERSAQDQKYKLYWKWRRSRRPPLKQRLLTKAQLEKLGQPPALTALPDWHLSLLAAMSPEQLRQHGDRIWREYWRHCMEKVGGKSRL